ncbi:hypothetical protein Tco_0591914 [Tanacetum coccineum]
MEKTKSSQSQSQSKSKVSHMKKIQLEGLKLPNLKLCYKKTTQMTLPPVIQVSNLQSPSQMILPPCASTSSISTSESEAEIESNVGTPIQEPIIVQDLPIMFLSCGSSTHLIKDCDFYEKQMANKTIGNGVGPVHSRNHVNHQNQFVPQAVLLRTGKVNIPPGSPQPVPTGKPKVPAPSSTGVINSPCYHNQELASPEQTATAEVVPKSVAGSSFPAASSTLLPFDVQVQQDYWYLYEENNINVSKFSCVQSPKTQADLDVAVKYVVPTGRVVVPTGRYIVPAGRVVVPTGRYIVPAGKVIIIVSTGRLSLVPTGRVLSPGRVK